jgi:hypothetical protein
MRPAEIASLRWSEVHCGWISFIRKGNVEREVPIHPNLDAILDAARTAGEFVFLSPSGGPISRPTLARWVREVACDAGIGDVTAHILRHTSLTAALEATHEYRGVYHVLGRALSPIDGVGPEALRLELLARRLDAGEVREVILATDPDVEGEATAMYLSHWLAGRPVRVTRIARGLPMGGDLDYADALTLIRALEGRQDMGADAPGLRS